MVDARFSWSGDPTSCQLKDINLHIAPGQLVAVCGQVGSCKSTLLAAIAGELNAMPNGDGSVCRVRANRMAYVPQEPWIQNMTLRENILFGVELETERYERVLDACALRDDLVLLPRGDATEIGEKVCRTQLVGQTNQAHFRAST